MKQFGTEFINYCLTHSIGKFNFSKNIFELTHEDYVKLSSLIKIYDGSNGGLVIGKSHEEGGIHLIQKNSSSTYKYVGEMEGFEFLSPPNLTKKQFDQLESINKKKSGDISSEFTMKKIIDLRSNTFQVIILDINTQFIINKNSTYNFHNEIEKIINYS